MQTAAFRARSATEIVDAAFRLYRAHFGALITATGLLIVPAMILKLLLPDLAANLVRAVERVLLTLSSAFIITVVSDAYLGRPSDIRAGLRAIRGRIGALHPAVCARPTTRLSAGVGSPTTWT